MGLNWMAQILLFHADRCNDIKIPLVVVVVPLVVVVVVVMAFKEMVIPLNLVVP